MMVRRPWTRADTRRIVGRRACCLVDYEGALGIDGGEREDRAQTAAARL